MDHMYFSSSTVVLDTKTRMLLPAEYREALAHAEKVEFQSRLYLSRRSLGDAPEHLACFGSSLVTSLASELDYCDSDRAHEIETILMETSVVKVDSAGRFSLGPDTVEALGLSDQVLIVGLGRFFEIWHPDHKADSRSALLSSYRRALRFMPTTQAEGGL